MRAKSPAPVSASVLRRTAAADAHDRRSLLRPRRRSPASCPSTAARARARRRARAGARSRAGWPRGPSANGGMVIRPVTRTGARSRNASSSPAGDRRSCDSSPARLTSTRTSVARVGVALELAQRRIAGHRLDQPHVRQDLLDLAALQLADEVPGEPVRPALGLGHELLGAVLAQERDAALGQRVELARVQVLDRGEDLELVRVAPGAARSPRARPRGSRPPARRSAPPRHPGLAAGRAAVAAMGEEQPRVGAQIVHTPTSWTAATPAASSSRRAIALRSTLRPLRTPGPWSAKAAWTSSPTS